LSAGSEASERSRLTGAPYVRDELSQTTANHAFSRIRVSHRLYGGFGAMLFILGGVALMGHDGITTMSANFDEYVEIAHKAVRVQ
jgi:hypothetical protein